MKKILLSTVAIVGIVSGASFAAQNTTHNMADHVSNTEVQNATHAESTSASASTHSEMPHMHGSMKGMKAHGKMSGKSKMMAHGMMGGKSCMMKGHHGMMHGMSGKMSHGKMGGHSGMKGHGMMGLGFHMPGQENWTPEQHEQFLNNTSELRKELVVKRYEIWEAKRNKSTTPDQLGKLDKELIDIRTKLQNKALEIKVPAGQE